MNQTNESNEPKSALRGLKTKRLGEERSLCRPEAKWKVGYLCYSGKLGRKLVNSGRILRRRRGLALNETLRGTLRSTHGANRRIRRARLRCPDGCESYQTIGESPQLRTRADGQRRSAFIALARFRTDREPRCSSDRVAGCSWDGSNNLPSSI